MHTIKVKINGAEFEASGEPEAVKEQYAEFIKLLAQQPMNVAANAQAAATRVASSEPTDSGGGETKAVRSLMDRVFRVDGDVISLNVLPTGEDAAFNAILLLLYAHDKLGGRSAVMVDSVLKGLNQSGATYGSNIARLIGGHAGLVTKAGVKRGTRYGLTNKGSQQAEEVLRKIV
jgi:hypothetical protein